MLFFITILFGAYFAAKLLNWIDLPDDIDFGIHLIFFIFIISVGVYSFL